MRKGESLGATSEVTAEGDFAYSDDLIRLAPDVQRVLPSFLQAFLASRAGARALQAISTGRSIPRISPRDLGHLDLWLPPLSVQAHIVESIGQIGELRSVASDFHQSLDRYADVFREGLISGSLRPFTGRSHG